MDQQATRRSSGLARLSDGFAGAVTRGLVAIFAALPHRVALGIARSAADLAYALGMRRRILRRNLELIYGQERSPEERARIARSATRNLFLTLVEGLRVSRPDARDEILSQVSFEPRALHEDLLRETRGIVFVVAHSGNFDLCGLRFAQGSDQRLAVVMKPPKAPAVNALLVEGRERFGFDVLSVSEPGLLRRLIRLTNRGGRVCLLPDQHARKTGVMTRFLGHPARTHRGPAFIALKSPAARLIVAVDTSIDDGPRHVCYFKEISDFEPSGDTRTDVVRLTQRINDAMGELIAKHPDSYLWHHSRWRIPTQRGIERAPAATSSEASTP